MSSMYRFKNGKGYIGFEDYIEDWLQTRKNERGCDPKCLCRSCYADIVLGAEEDVVSDEHRRKRFKKEVEDEKKAIAKAKEEEKNKLNFPRWFVQEIAEKLRQQNAKIAAEKLAKSPLPEKDVDDYDGGKEYNVKDSNFGDVGFDSVDVNNSSAVQGSAAATDFVDAGHSRSDDKDSDSEPTLDGNDTGLSDSEAEVKANNDVICTAE